MKILIILILFVCCCKTINIYDNISNQIQKITNIANKMIIKNLIDIWYSFNKPELKILLYGKTGVGKSTLLNNLFNQKLSETGNFERTTKEILKFSKDINGVLVHFYDSPSRLV